MMVKQQQSFATKRRPQTEAEFAELAFQQLKQIFPVVEMERQLKTADVRMIVDLTAHSSNGRLILFELKRVSPGRTLTYSEYPSVAALKDAVAHISPEAPPIVAVLATGHVDESVRTMFAQSGIPVANLADNPDQTRANLREAFQQFAIALPELALEREVPRGEQGLCFVSMPLLPEYEEIYERAIKPAIRQAGFEPLEPRQFSKVGPVFEAIPDVIRRSRVIIADVTNRNPNVFLELGIAHALGKNTLLITQNMDDIPFDLRRWRVLQYQYTPDGLEKLKAILAESLVTVQKRRPIESHYMRLLELLFTVVQSLVGWDPGDDQRIFVDDAESLAQKFFFHGLSTLYLSRGTVLPDLSFKANFGDFTSTIVLVRAMLETYLTFHYTYIEPKNDPPLREFRRLSRILYSLLQRQKYPIRIPEAAQQLTRDRTIIEEVRSKLQTNSIYLKLDTDKQRELLKEGKIAGKGPPFQPWIEIAKQTGLPPKSAQTVYSFLSIHAHSGYISTLQVRQTKTAEEQRELTEGALTVAVTTTAKMIFSYCELFPKAGEVLKEKEDAARLAEIYVGASQIL